MVLSRKRRRLALPALLLLTLIAGCGGGNDDEEKRPVADGPNVVVVMTDDQAIDTMLAMPMTRRLLGARGVTFRTAIASFPLCCPARATFLTGQYAHNHGVLDNHAPAGGIGALDQSQTLPVWLHDAGYTTAFVGKYLNGYGQEENGGPTFIPPGWDDWYAETADDKTSSYDYEMNLNGELRSFDHAESDYKTDVLAGLAQDVIREHEGNRPLFLWVATSAPHTDDGIPATAPRNPEPAPRHEGTYDGVAPDLGPAYNEADVSDKPPYVAELPPLGMLDRREIDRTYVSQLESLRAVDELVAGVVAALRETGELNDTLLMFTSDNGFLRGQHRLDSGKAKMYEEAIRVPLIVRGPGFTGGLEVDRPVANTDLAATIAAIGGADPGLDIDGVQLEDALQPEGEDRAVLIEVFERKADQFSGLRTADYAYAEREGNAELYDLANDPFELENVVGDPAYADVQAELAERLADLRDCAGESCS